MLKEELNGFCMALPDSILGVSGAPVTCNRGKRHHAELENTNENKNW